MEVRRRRVMYGSALSGERNGYQVTEQTAYEIDGKEWLTGNYASLFRVRRSGHEFMGLPLYVAVEPFESSNLTALLDKLDGAPEEIPDTRAVVELPADGRYTEANTT